VSKTSVLVIDNDPATESVVSQEVDAARADTVVVGDVKAAHDYCKKRKPALIVLNVDLPKGWRLCTELKKSKKYRQVPLVVISEKATDDIFQQHMNLPTRADAYQNKPLDQDTLSLTFIGLLDYELGDPVDADGDELDFELDFEMEVEDDEEPEAPPKAEEIFDPTELQNRITELEEALKRERDGLDERLRAQAETGKKNVMAAVSERDEARAKIVELEGQLSQAQTAASEAGDAATNQSAELSRQLEELRQQKEAVEAERDAKSEQAGTASTQVEELTKQVEELTQKVADLTEERDSAQTAADEAARAAVDAAEAAQQAAAAQQSASSDVEKSATEAREANAKAEAAEIRAKAAEERADGAEKRAGELDSKYADAVKRATETDMALREAIAAYQMREGGFKQMADNAASQASALRATLSSVLAEAKKAIEAPIPQPVELSPPPDGVPAPLSFDGAPAAAPAPKVPPPRPGAAPPAPEPAAPLEPAPETDAPAVEADEAPAAPPGPPGGPPPPPPLPGQLPDPVIETDIFAEEPELVDIMPFTGDD